MVALRRRELLGLFGTAAATWPLAARAQQSDRVKHIGVLSVGNDPRLEKGEYEERVKCKLSRYGYGY